MLSLEVSSEEMKDIALMIIEGDIKELEEIVEDGEKVLGYQLSERVFIYRAKRLYNCNKAIASWWYASFTMIVKRIEELKKNVFKR